MTEHPTPAVSASGILSAARLLLLAALAGGAVMVLEIAAPRLVAPRLGTGALAWTVTIATFLAGLSAGYVLGGRLADRLGRVLLPGLFVLAALITVLTPPLHDAASGLVGALPHAWRVLVAIPLAFLPISVVLGSVVPVLARSLLRTGGAPGLRLGALAAAGSVGSVAGTLLAGFELVPSYGTRGVFLWTAAVLVAAAVVCPLKRLGAAPSPSRPAAAPARRLWVLLAFIAGAGVLTLEILAGRLASYHLGASLYTWTSVIGVVLTGLALGSVVAGWLADRIEPRRLLGMLLLAASAASCLLLWAHAILPLADRWANDGTLSWPQAVLAVTALTFLLPSVVLGAVSPVVIRAALRDPAHDGRVVGGLYAAGTLGAVVGAVAIGYLLIPWAGLERLILFLAFGLASAGGAVRGRQSYAMFAVVVGLAMLLQGPWPEGHALARTIGIAEDDDDLLVEDSRLSRICIQPIQGESRSVPLARGLGTIAVHQETLFGGQGMYDEEAGRLHWRGRMTEPQKARLLEMVDTDEAAKAVERMYDVTHHQRRRLSLDRLVHGYIDMQDPGWLGYGYERLYAAALARIWPEADEVRCFFIGGGAYAIQRHLFHVHGDGVYCVSSEIDPQVTDVARRGLDLVENASHLIVHEDARTYIDNLPREHGRFDVVFGDAFDHIAVPFQLTTIEFARSLKSRMSKRGIYLVNVVDSWDSGRFLGAFVSTLGKVFEHVHVVATLPLRADKRDTYVIVASDASLDSLGVLLTTEEGELAVVVRPENIHEMLDRTGRRILTDDDAPVENLLAPVLHAR